MEDASPTRLQHTSRVGRSGVYLNYMQRGEERENLDSYLGSCTLSGFDGSPIGETRWGLRVSRLSACSIDISCLAAVSSRLLR